MEMEIELRLQIDGDALRVTALNTGAHAVRLWSVDNSWGWSMFSLLVAAPGSEQWRALTARLVAWTVNLPDTVSIPAGAAHEFLLRRGHPAWEGLASDLANDRLQVRVRLNAGQTPEARAKGVFTGEVVSPAVMSLPPHRWLV
jgi:hypothetical protein